MDKQDIWYEICFLLSEITSPNISEQLYELRVIQAFEKLGWSQYRKEISVRENIQLGSANRIYPDLIFKTQPSGKNIFVVEIKKPSADINDSSFKNQLYSYMRMLKLDFGLLVGSKIQLYADRSSVNPDNLTLIEEFPISSYSILGAKFVELFHKNSFDPDIIEKYITNKIENIEALRLKNIIKKEIFSDKYLEKITDFIKTDFHERYQVKDLDKIIDDLSFKLTDSTKKILPHSQDHTSIRGQKQNFERQFKQKKSSEKITKNGMKIGEFVKNTFKTLYHEKILTEEDLTNLQNKAYCKINFKTPKPLFLNKEVGIEGITDDVGIKRYYANEFFYYDYYLYSQWAERHWIYFLTWLNRIGYNISMDFDSK